MKDLYSHTYSSLKALYGIKLNYTLRINLATKEVFAEKRIKSKWFRDI